MQYLQNLSGGGVVLVLAGLLLLAIGAAVLWRGRGGGESGGVGHRLPVIGAVREPTRLVIGACGVVLGYHLVVWALPRGVTPVQLPREWWWAIVLGMVGVVWGSVVMDRREGR